MKTRVTITLDPEVHRLAKQKPRRKHTTVSGLIESLLQSATSTKDDDWVAGMMGITGLRDSIPGADRIVTRNLPDYKHSSVQAISPAEFLKRL